MTDAKRERTVDYDIHGLLGLRALSPPPALAREIARQMDPLRPTALTAAPDISLTPFHDDSGAKMAYELGDAGDSQHSTFEWPDFWLSNDKKMLRIPFLSIGTGETCDIRYAPGIGFRRMFLNYVRPLLQLSLPSKGAAAVHSAAVSYKGQGLIFAGWAESGKTEAALGFIRHGATFVSDKWSILTEAGDTVYNFPTPITIRGWMLRYLPALAQGLPPVHRWRVRAATVLAATVDGTSDSSIPLARRLSNAVSPAVSLGTRASVTASQLFGHPKGHGRAERMSPSAPLAKLFLLMTSNRGISVSRADLDEVASRLVDCAEYERRGVLGLYKRFRYAYPNTRSPAIEEAPERERGVLKKALGSKEVFLVEAPFPFDPEAIFNAISPHC
ncbi:MAG: hypothetical protein V3S01_03755 [Dehalococcoidia bacterium]